MSQNVSIPFHVCKLVFQGDETVTVPLSDTNAMHLKKDTEAMAKKFAERYQKKLLDQGEYDRILDEIRGKDFTKTQVGVSFPAAKDGISFPAFELVFDCFWQPSKTGIWGVLPALGLECMAEDEASFPARMEEIIRMDFTAKKRLSAAQTILSTLWLEQATLELSELNLTFHNPSEILAVEKAQEQLLLPKAATKLEPPATEAYGRQDELGRVSRILEGRFSKNILLVGASSTGKTAIVREIAHRRLKGGAANAIWETTASRLIKELTSETGWQDNLSLFVKELTKRGDFLFVRNLAELFEVGKYEGNEVSMADYLRSPVSRGELTIISECTPEEKARIDLQSPNFLAPFQVIEILEPRQGLEDIIRLKVADLAGKKQVSFELGAVEEVIRLHRRFMPYSGMPGRPIRFLESVLLSMVVTEIDKKSKKAKKKKAAAAAAAEVEAPEPPRPITRETVLRSFCEDSGMPRFLIDPALPMDVDAIRREFNSNVFGQERAVEAVTGLLAAVKTALTRTGKPIASFLFVGPTGVGKTELAKVLANFTFSSRERMVRFDMSEYSDAWSVMRLTGQHYNADGLLTSAVRREPFCVLLFDEIEKAHPTFFDLLLQILGEGRLSDSRGKLVNFCSAIIVMTSNIGAGTLQQHRIGWKKGLDTADVTSHFTRAVEKHFKPELFNRIDSVVTFEPLSAETVRYVVEREIALFKKREGIRFRRLDLHIADAVLDHIARIGHDPRFGARYLQRTLRETLIVPLAHSLNLYEHDDRMSVRVAMENGELAIHTTSDPLAFDLLMEQWDKLTLAEETSALRRKMMLMLEGPVFMRLGSELDILEADKKRLGERFWENVPKAGQYTFMVTANERSGLRYAEIQDLEMEIALASMEHGEYRIDFPARLEGWADALFELQVLVHSLLFPEENTCHFGLYGQGFAPALHFYQALFLEKGFQVEKATTIWYRDGHFELQADETGNGSPDGKPKRKLAYLEEDLPPGLLNAPDIGDFHPADLLCGVELTVTGDAVARYLRSETGFQHWDLTGNNELLPFYVRVLERKTASPDYVHRSAFYQKSRLRRMVKNGFFTDEKLQLPSTVKPAERVDLVIGELDRLFAAGLDQFFLGGPPE